MKKEEKKDMVTLELNEEDIRLVLLIVRMRQEQIRKMPETAYVAGKFNVIDLRLDQLRKKVEDQANGIRPRTFAQIEANEKIKDAPEERNIKGRIIEIVG
jgi:hypothetical protein